MGMFTLLVVMTAVALGVGVFLYVRSEDRRIGGMFLLLSVGLMTLGHHELGMRIDPQAVSPLFGVCVIAFVFLYTWFGSLYGFKAILARD